MKTSVIYIILIYFVLKIETKAVNQDDNQKSKKLIENKDRYGGDMLGLVPQQKGVARKASTGASRLWPNNTIFYIIDKNAFSVYERNLIESTMKYMESVCCLKFKQRDNNERDYINIIKEVGCYSYVGRNGYAQDLSLGKGCVYKGTIIHELMHAIGFYHEHMRSDRDSYLIIHMNRVMSGMGNNFEKNPSYMNRLFAKFDYNSIMIYSSTAFSKNGQMTMEPKDKKYKLKEPYDKSQMTALDAFSINKMYGCPQH